MIKRLDIIIKSRSLRNDPQAPFWCVVLVVLGMIERENVIYANVL